jgi:hypothetical protein
MKNRDAGWIMLSLLTAPIAIGCVIVAVLLLVLAVMI